MGVVSECCCKEVYYCERSEPPSLANCPRCLYLYKYKKTFKNEQRNRVDTAKKKELIQVE